MDCGRGNTADIILIRIRLRIIHYVLRRLCSFVAGHVIEVKQRSLQVQSFPYGCAMRSVPQSVGDEGANFRLAGGP